MATFFNIYMRNLFTYYRYSAGFLNVFTRIDYLVLV